MNENNDIKWNYNMGDAPRNRDLILVSDGQNIWSVYWRKEGSPCSFQCGWWSDEGYWLDEGDDVAWAPINLPDKKGDPKEAKRRSNIAWNNVEKMIEEMDGKNGIQVVGRKEENGQQVYEFIVYNEIVFWVIEPSSLMDKGGVL